MQATTSRLMVRFKQGSVTVVRETAEGERPAELPTWEEWKPTIETRVYELDATVTGVPEKLVDGDSIKATDLMVTCSDVMRLVLIDGVSVAAQEVEFDAGLLDTLRIDGKTATVQKPMPVPAAGVKIVHKYVVRQ